MTGAFLFSPFQSRTPTQRTEGVSLAAGVAEGISGGVEVRSAAVTAGVAEETGVSSARSSPDENWKASTLKATENGRDIVRNAGTWCRRIRTVEPLRRGGEQFHRWDSDRDGSLGTKGEAKRSLLSSRKKKRRPKIVGAVEKM